MAGSDGHNKISVISKEQMAPVEETVQRKTDTRVLTNGPGEQEGVACGVLESMYWVLTRLFQAHLSVQFGSWPRSSVPGRRGAWWELFPTLTPPLPLMGHVTGALQPLLGNTDFRWGRAEHSYFLRLR